MLLKCCTSSIFIVGKLFGEYCDIQIAIDCEIKLYNYISMLLIELVLDT